MHFLGFGLLGSATFMSVQNGRSYSEFVSILLHVIFYTQNIPSIEKNSERKAK